MEERGGVVGVGVSRLRIDRYNCGPSRSVGVDEKRERGVVELRGLLRLRLRLRLRLGVLSSFTLNRFVGLCE